MDAEAVVEVDVVMVDENLTSFATYVRNMAMKCFSAITDMIRTTKVPARMTTTMVQLQPI